MRIKSKDIADALGISTTAVSLAVNNKPGVSEETRRKVMQMLNESTTKAYHSFESERMSRAGSILLSVHKKHGKIINDKPFFTNLTETVQQEVAEQSYSLVLSHYQPGQDISEYIQYIKSLEIDGVIVLATELDQNDVECYKQVGKPVVLMDASFEFCDMDSVALDNQTSMFRAVDYVYRMGHREIGYLQSSVYINNFGHRFDGYQKGLREYGLLGSNHPVISLGCTLEDAYQDMKEFLENLPADFKMPTVFLTDLDYIAVGAMKALHEKSYRIPEDVSIVGYDDVSVSQVCSPTLTTVQVNRMDIGRLTAKRLIEIINHPSDCYTTMQVSSKFIVRESVRDLN